MLLSMCMGTLLGHRGLFIWGLGSLLGPCGVIGGHLYKAQEVSTMIIVLLYQPKRPNLERLAENGFAEWYNPCKSRLHSKPQNVRHGTELQVLYNVVQAHCSNHVVQINLPNITKTYIFRTAMESTFTWTMPYKSISGLNHLIVVNPRSGAHTINDYIYYYQMVFKRFMLC